MSVAAANAVMDRLENDEAFAQRLKEAGGPEATLGILRDEGFDVTPDEMRDVLIDRFGDQLTQEQLDAISGGDLNEGHIIVAATLGAELLIAGAAAAAAL